MIQLLKTALKTSFRSLGFDIVRIKNLEAEISRREKARERNKIEHFKALREIREQSGTPSGTGEIRFVQADELEGEGSRLMRPATVVLDIGCAFRPQPYINAGIHICCEPFHEYMDRLKRETEGEAKYVFLHCDLEQACRLFPRASVDTAFLIDVIEHIDKGLGQKALAQLKQIVRSQIVIFTPIGYMEQEPENAHVDQWGMGGADWQKHRSGWIPEDFPVVDGWSIVACERFFAENAYGRTLETPIGAFWAVWNRG